MPRRIKSKGDGRPISFPDLPWKGGDQVNRHGQAARQAYDPTRVLAFIERLDQGQGFSRNELWDDSTTGRTIRRWEGQKGVTPWSLNGVLRAYTHERSGDVLDHTDFEEWAGPAAKIRG